MSATTFIYALCEPGTRTIRYFGKADDPKKRLTCHISVAKDGEKWPVSRWIRKLLKAGQCPDVHTLCEVQQDDFERFECAFIALGRHYGLRLLNATDGGEGTSGYQHSLAARVKMSTAKKGNKLSPEHCASLSAGQKGKKKSPRLPEHSAKISAALTGRKLTPAHCANISAGELGCNRSDNTSGFVGVSRGRRGKGWRARIDKKQLGSFSKIEDAIFARNLAIANLL